MCCLQNFLHNKYTCFVFILPAAKKVLTHYPCIVYLLPRSRQTPKNPDNSLVSLQNEPIVRECMSRPKEATVFDPNSKEEPSCVCVCVSKFELCVRARCAN